MQALFDRTRFSGGFQFGPIRRGQRFASGEDQPGLQRADAADRIGGHLLDDLDLEAVYVQVVALCHQPYDRCHAGAQRRRNQVGGRKGSAFAAVIHRGVRGLSLFGRSMYRGAVQPALVSDIDFYGHK